MSVLRKYVSLSMVMILLLSFYSTAFAAGDDQVLRASPYIRSSSINVFADGNGKLRVESYVGATGVADKLGIKELSIQKKSNGYWLPVEILISDNYKDDAISYIYDTFYYGSAGTTYRAYVEFYVEKDNGSETKISVSSPVTLE
ncbi:hypothetical protein [Paenibacillus sp. sgz500992]|uniref:hypothetical protein n=1 Tax=Paenibacillus sp. sgz500992 TaxID=3242476 RepID=UPI0036D29CEF